MMGLSSLLQKAKPQPVAVQVRVAPRPAKSIPPPPASLGAAPTAGNGRGRRYTVRTTCRVSRGRGVSKAVGKFSYRLLREAGCCATAKLRLGGGRAASLVSKRDSKHLKRNDGIGSASGEFSTGRSILFHSDLGAASWE